MRKKSYCFALSIVSLVIFFFIACKKEAPPSSRTKVSELSKIEINEQSKGLFTFYDQEHNQFKSVNSIKEIPADSQRWVRYIDLKQKPQTRQDLTLVYVANLENKKDGQYPYVVMSREAFETAAQNKNASPLAKLNANAKVTIYSTSWCSACRQAKAWFRKKGIPFNDKDIEKDQLAANELMKKAQAQGIKTSGVPVIEINKKLVQGFNPQLIQQLLSK